MASTGGGGILESSSHEDLGACRDLFLRYVSGSPFLREASYDVALMQVMYRRIRLQMDLLLMLTPPHQPTAGDRGGLHDIPWKIQPVSDLRQLGEGVGRAPLTGA